MADSIVGGLFGMTPEMYQQQQSQQALNQAAQLAQLDPFALAKTGIGYGANRLAGAIGGMLGGQDPQLQIISARNAVMREVDPNNPNSLQGAIQKLSAAGDQAGALQLSDYLRKAQGDYALIQQRTAEKMTNEQRNALAYAASTGAPQGSPEFSQAYQQKLSELITKNENATPEMKNAAAVAAASFPMGSQEYKELYKNELARLTTKESKENVKEVGVAAGTREAVYLDVNKDQQFVYQKGADGKQIRVPYFGGIDRTTATTKVEVDKGETEFKKRLGLKDADRVDSAMSMRDSSIAALNSLNRLNQLDQSALISGTFANGRVGATNLLNTLGLTSAKDQGDLAKSENYQKTAGDVILATLGGKLGAGFSNEDRRFIQSLVPQLENSPQARKQLIEFMVKKNQAIVGETTRLENYARENNGLKGFVPTIPLVSGQQPTTSGALQSMSTEQLQQMLKNAK
jgi:hypothetical protein